ncbi:hypothetical protein [Ekhidna sp.]
MKNFLISILLVPSLLYSQEGFDEWTTTEQVDEFGDKTGTYVSTYYNMGTFSNSAATNEEVIVAIVDYGDSFLINFYEYGNPPAAQLTYDGSFGEISVKRADGTIERYEVFAPESGGIYIRSQSPLFDILKNTVSEKLKIAVFEDAFSDYGNSKYIFTVETKG